MVTTVHASAGTPNDLGPPGGGQFFSPMNHPNNVSYTTSPHALGSSQWAPPNANLFSQSNAGQSHPALHKGAAVPPNAAYPNQQGGPAFDGGGAGDPARSQGSNLSAAAAAAAAVMAAATATAHATATLTLKPGEVRMQPQGFDGVGSTPPGPPLHIHPPQSTPPQQQQHPQTQQPMLPATPHQVCIDYTCTCTPVYIHVELVKTLSRLSIIAWLTG